MDLFTTARRLESMIAGRLDSAAQRTLGSPARDPLAVIQSVVEAIDAHVQPIGRGRRIFPYNAVTVTLAASPDERIRFEAVLEHEPSLGDRIVERVRALGADVEALDLTVLYAPAPRSDWNGAAFRLELARRQRPVEVVAAEPPAPGPISLAVAHGAAEQPAYALAQARIDLGRGRDVRDLRHQLLRTNHVAFIDEGGAGPNPSVSRRHAHIAWDFTAREYRVFDDGSAHGTHVLRGGLAIPVRAGARGLRLRDGDEIVLGEARVRVALGEARLQPRSEAPPSAGP